LPNLADVGESQCIDDTDAGPAPPSAGGPAPIRPKKRCPLRKSAGAVVSGKALFEQRREPSLLLRRPDCSSRSANPFHPSATAGPRWQLRPASAGIFRILCGFPPRFPVLHGTAKFPGRRLSGKRSRRRANFLDTRWAEQSSSRPPGFDRARLAARVGPGGKPLVLPLAAVPSSSLVLGIAKRGSCAPRSRQLVPPTALGDRLPESSPARIRSSSFRAGRNYGVEAPRSVAVAPLWNRGPRPRPCAPRPGGRRLLEALFKPAGPSKRWPQNPSGARGRRPLFACSTPAPCRGPY